MLAAKSVGAFVSLTLMMVCGCSRPAPGTLAITHVTLIDGTGAASQENMTVVVADRKIAGIFPSASAEIPRGSQILDARGKFLIPGLVDTHVHLTGSGEPSGSREYIVPLLVANGITTVRDMGGYLESLIPLRQDIRDGKRTGPQIFFAGPYLDGSPPSFQPSLVVTNAVQAEEDVRTLEQRGVDFIKVQSILDRDAYFGIAKACRQQHISFVGHVPDRVTAAEASDAGQKSIEHLTGVLRACAKDEKKLMREQMANGNRRESPAKSHERELAWENELLRAYSVETATALFQKFVANHTWQVPTLILLKTLAYPARMPDAAGLHEEYVPRKLQAQWQKAWRDRKLTSQDFSENAAMLQKSEEVVSAMHASGVSILAGTDTGAPSLVPGFALHDELALLVEAGLSPMEALQAATKGPAEFLDKAKTQGTIEPGKFADLLLLDGDPLADIRNIRKIWAVILRGKLLDRAALDGMLESEQQFAASH